MVRKVFIPCCGGLGDVLMTYLSNPISHIETGPGDPYPTASHVSSLWFRRLEDFKLHHGQVHVKLIAFVHNPKAIELFEHHPCIDEIDLWQWRLPEEGDGLMWDKKYNGSVHIGKGFNYDQYKVSEPVMYMPNHEVDLVERLKLLKPYIAIHPFASWPRQALSMIGYIPIIDGLVSSGLNVVVVGGSYVVNVKLDSSELPPRYADTWLYQTDGLVNLINKVSARVSTQVVMNSDGFMGTFSCMMLVAWYKRLKSVVFLPEPSASWSLEHQSPVVKWGLDKPFTKVVETGNAVDHKSIVQWLEVENDIEVSVRE